MTQTTTTNVVDRANRTAEDIANILAEATVAAQLAVSEAVIDYKAKYPDDAYGEPMYCGFAWVNIYGIKASTKEGRAMKQAGLKKDYSGAFSIWNPGNHAGQSMDFKEVGAYAYAKVLEVYGYRAYAGSRAD